MDLTPNPTPARRRRRRTAVLGAVVVVVLGVVVVRGLGDATLYFHNVDEAVAMRAELGDDRFRLQGAVVDGTVDRAGEVTSFDVTYNGVQATVRHRGEIPKMFAAGIPVVLEGRWSGDAFASDRMLVKHSEVYVAENPDRVTGYGESTPTS